MTVESPSVNGLCGKSPGNELIGFVPALTTVQSQARRLLYLEGSFSGSSVDSLPLSNAHFLDPNYRALFRVDQTRSRPAIVGPHVHTKIAP
jgi:hypothetical protein